MPITKVDGKKDGKQKYRVRVNYTDSNGTYKQMERTAYGLDEAKQVERELNITLNQDTPAAKLTVGTLAVEYLEAKKYEVRESTLDKTRRNLDLYVLKDLSDKRIDKLTPPILQKWKQSIEEFGLGLTTKKNAYGEFRTLLNYAVKMDYLPKNPLAKIGSFKSTLELKKEMDYYTVEEFSKFITVARQEADKKDNWNFYIFFFIAFFTGLRKGEIYALQWTDIKDGYLSVTKSITQKLKGADRVTPPKNRSSIRTLQLPIPLVNKLNEHYTRCKKYADFSDINYICSVRDSSLQKANERYAKTAGLKTIRIHDYRHSHASLLANEGINIQEIARRLGHSKISMTWETYSHLYPREEERAVNILNKIGDFSGI